MSLHREYENPYQLFLNLSLPRGTLKTVELSQTSFAHKI